MSPDGKNHSPLSQREIPVLLTVDVCDGAHDRGDRKPRFKDVMDILPEIGDILGEAISQKGNAPLGMTWFVRSDGQVAEHTGSAAGLVRGWSGFWEDIRENGGEVAWHPHLYKRRAQTWIPIRDPKRLAGEAERIWNEINSEGWRPVSARMGETVGSTELMNFLDSAGIRTDASALPGRSRDDGMRLFDWKRTPSEPYHPARGDYRRPPRPLGAGDKVEGERPLKLLEVPFTMAGIRAPYDPKGQSSRPSRRYVDLSYAPDRFRKGLGSQLKKIRYLVLVVHPLQASGREVPEGDLVVGGFDALRDNLRFVLDTIDRADRIPRFTTTSEFRRLWLGETGKEKDELPLPRTRSAERRESRDARKKGGSRRSSFEGDKAVRRGPPSRGAVRGGSRPPRRGPRKRRG